MSDDNGAPAPQKQGLSPAWAPGQSGNPAGRPKGSRNKLGEAFLDDMLADWEKHGKAAIEKVRETKPDAYLKVVAMILPRDLNVNINNMEQLTDDELVERIRSLDAAIRPFLDAQGESGTGGGAQRATAH